MANIIIPNFTPAITGSGTTDTWSIMWKLTRAMKAAGWLYKSSSDGTTKETTGIATNDKWGGNANPLNDTYPSFSGGNTAATAWWCAQGPSTLKIPITSAQTPGANGPFFRGENISQATTGAQGELLSYIFDATDGYGYLVVLPRVVGSGADGYGWDHSHVITGAFSGATITPSAALTDFVREIVFWKDASLNNQTVYMQCVSNTSENASRFSVLASSAGCTGSVAPGGGGTGNTFPAVGSYTAGGTGGSQSASAIGLTLTTASNLSRSQLMVANCTYSNGISADGSFVYVIATTIGGQAADSAGSAYLTIGGYQRCDNQEDGDVDPFAFYAQSGDNNSNGVGAANKLTNSSASNLMVSFSSSWNVPNSGATMFRMWRRRGFTTGDAFVNGCPATIMFGQAPAITGVANTRNIPNTGNPIERDRMGTAFTDTYVGDDIWVVSPYTSNKMRKGVLRWIRLITGVPDQEYGFNSLRNWLSVSSGLPNGTIQGGLLIGPWDGSTIVSTQ